ncbi:hypothetical protein ACFQPA_20225 [Halomarina halobia]|uniref:BppU N-terminal domain-containing protein n=1 Tax=Halomarina halobia TaxID=3033386 RepID=A0ABD6AFJ1_9EURY|nr:hypothetical protein [Halomarina sp. PSR21]
MTAEDGIVTLQADLQNTEDLKSTKLVKNGAVVKTFDLDGEETTISYDVDVSGTKWFVLHVEDAEGDRTMTSPIYATSDSTDDNGGNLTNGNDRQTSIQFLEELIELLEKLIEDLGASNVTSTI